MLAWINKQPRRKWKEKKKSGFNTQRVSGEKAFHPGPFSRISVATPYNSCFEAAADHISTFIISEVMQLNMPSFHLNYPGSFGHS